MARVKQRPSEATDSTGDTNKKPQIVRANIKRNIERSEDFVDLYANDAQFQTTPWDIRVTFGRIVNTPNTADMSIKVKEIADLHMSPVFAKRVAMVLIGQIRHYEQTIGPIPVLPED